MTETPFEVLRTSFRREVPASDAHGKLLPESLCLGHGARKECQVTRNIEENDSSAGRQAPEQDGRASQESSESMLLCSKTQLSPSSSTLSSNALGKRECEVIRLLAEGKSSKEIAPLMSITVTTVETYRARIMMKLDLHSVGQLIRYAVQNKLVQF
jgi:DNA-binding NarL/FixJ family response regulator